MRARDFLRLGCFAVLLALAACERDAPTGQSGAASDRTRTGQSGAASDRTRTGQSGGASNRTATGNGVSSHSPAALGSALGPALPVAPASPVTASLACPSGTLRVDGGDFWVGSEEGTYSGDESPRYRTEIASFCMDETEVTVDAFVDCVRRGACTPPHDDRPHCNTRAGAPRSERGNHPINCVDWFQAKAYCESGGKRLPTEAEWEYAARGGGRYLEYPWGDADPDGRTCWKHNGTCPVKSFAPGAFGLFDVSGNVWEWTADWYGAYPWPPLDAYARVYRGGSWSRRFAKWLHTRLRDRDDPKHWGSHLGFRCVVTPASVHCPFGRSEDGAGCLHGVLERSCGPGAHFNGVRCTHDGDPRCGAGRREVPGHGCVLVDAVPDAAEVVDPASVSREPSPQFDADCAQNAPSRPHAWRYFGGTHRARNLVSGQAGCKNRDVGVGWNSTCCP